MAVPVSVVIPYYNASEFLPECLESVRRQTSPPTEIIIVDDGSDPESRVGLLDLDDGVVVLKHTRNLGPGVARNTAVDASTQPSIAFLDADDSWRPEKLEPQYELMAAWPDLDATHTGARFFDEEGEIAFNPGPRRRHSEEQALTNYRLVTPSMMIERESLLRIGGFDPRFRCTQDWDLHVRMVLAGFLIEFVPEMLVSVRRQDHGNHSSDWRCFLAGHLGVVMKHRRAYIDRLGYRDWLHQLAFELHRGGRLQGGSLGRLFQLPFRFGI